MFKTTEYLVNYKIHSVIHFFNALKHIALPTRQKFNQTISTHKIMCTSFCVRQSIILVNFTSRNKTVNAVSSAESLKKLSYAFQNKRPACLLMISFSWNTMPDQMPLVWLKMSSSPSVWWANDCQQINSFCWRFKLVRVSSY